MKNVMDPGLRVQPFFKVKVSLTLREVILPHDNSYLIICFFDLVLCLIDKADPKIIHLLTFINFLDIRSEKRPKKFHA